MSRRDVSFTPYVSNDYPVFDVSFPSALQAADSMPYLYFTIPLFMGVIVFFVVLIFVLSGVYGVSLTQTPQRWADTTDKVLQVPAQ